MLGYIYLNEVGRLIHEYFVSMQGFTDNGKDIEYVVGIVATESNSTNGGCGCRKF